MWRLKAIRAGFLLALCLVGGAELMANTPKKVFARAALKPKSGSMTTGTVEFTRLDKGIEIHATVENTKTGKHGIHLHEKGDCSAKDASSAGDHYNPTTAQHGSPREMPHHLGDLGNIDVGKDGRGELRLALTGEDYDIGDRWKDILNRSVVVHAHEDDLKTQPSGASGERVACGVIQSAEAVTIP